MSRTRLLSFLFTMLLVPLFASVAWATDTDSDGLEDSLETALGTDPNDSDSDDDGWSDGFEILESGSDALLDDTDLDTDLDSVDADPFDPGSGDLDGVSSVDYAGAPTTEAYAPAGTSPVAGFGVHLNSGVLVRRYSFGRSPGVRTTVLHASRGGGAPSPRTSTLMDFDLSVVYRSDSKFNGTLGLGMFAELLDARYTVNGGGDFTVLREDGIWVTYVKSGSDYVTPTGMRDTLTLVSSVYTRTSPEGVKHVYASGVLDKIEDRFGNSIDPSHSSGVVTSITDSRGKTHTVNHYSGTGRVSELAMADGGLWEFQYNPNAELMRVVGPNTSQPVGGITLGFLYVNASPSSPLHANLLAEIDGRGTAWLRMVYDANDRVTAQKVGGGSDQFTFDYTNAASQEVTVTDRMGNDTVWTWNSTTLALASLVEETNRGVRSGEGDYTTTWTTNGAGYVTAVEYPNGNGVKWTLNGVQIPTERRRKADMGAADGGSDLVETWTLDSAKYYAPTAYVDPRGHETEYTLNSKGQPTTIEFETLAEPDPDVTVENVYTYNGDGTLASFEDGEGYVTSFAYYTSGYGDGLLQTTTVDDGGLDLVTTLTYTAWGDVATVTNPRGKTTTLTVERYGNVTSVQAPSSLGYETQTEYDGNLNVTAVKRKNIDWDGTWLSSPYWFDTAVAYNSRNRPTTVIERISSSSTRSTDFTYDDNDQMVTRTRLGNAWSYTWDERGLLYQRVGDPGTSPHIAATEEFTYDGNRHLTDYENARGHHTLTEWDLYDRPEKVIDALGNYTLRVFDQASNVTEVKRYDEDGATDILLAHHKSHFDEMGRLWKEEDVLQGSTDQWFVRTRTLDDRGLMTAHNDRRGYDWLHVYDGAGRLIEEEDPAGDVKQFDLDECGNVTTLTEIEKLHGTSTTETYVTHFAYDDLDRMTSRTVVDRTNSSNTLVTQFKLDAWNFLRKRIDPKGNVTWFERDGLGRRLEERVEMGVSHEMVTLWTYDDHDNVTVYEDDNGSQTLYDYDDLNRLILKTYESAATVAYERDPNGNAIEIIDQNGTEIDQGFDALDRVTARAYTLASGVGGITAEGFTYDALGRMTEATNDDSVVQFTYDSLSRILTETQGPNPLGGSGKTVTNSWDQEGNLTGIEYPSSFEVVRTYAETPMLTALEDGSSNPIASFQHWHRIDNVEFGNGTTTDYTYDGFRRVTGIAHEDGSSYEFAGFTYAYDDNGNPLYEARSHQSGAGDVYTYDAADRLVRTLTAVADPANEIANPGSEVYDDKLEYDMDDVHNLVSYDVTPYGGSVTSLAYTTNAMNEYTAIGASSPTYDANGNLKDDGSKLYKYDGRNRLIEVRDKGTSNVLMTAKFDAVGFEGGTMSGMAMECCPPMMAVPGFGRRIEKSDGTTATRTIYQGENAVEEYVGGSLARKFVYADGLDRPVMMEAPDVADVDGDTNDTELQRFWYHTQLVGSVTQLTDASEDVVESYEYDPYGATTIRNQSGTPVSASAVGNPWMYTARQNDTEAGLYHYRARAYSPEMRRFVQRDPLEYVDGPSALTYAGASPIGRFDPLGLKDEKLSPRDEAAQRGADTAETAANDAGDPDAADRVAEARDSIRANDDPNDDTAETTRDGTVKLPFPDVSRPTRMVCPCTFPISPNISFGWFLATAYHEAQHKENPNRRGVNAGYGKDAKHAAIYKSTADTLWRLYQHWRKNGGLCPCGCGIRWRNGGKELRRARYEQLRQYRALK